MSSFYLFLKNSQYAAMAIAMTASSARSSHHGKPPRGCSGVGVRVAGAGVVVGVIVGAGVIVGVTVTVGSAVTVLLPIAPLL